MASRCLRCGYNLHTLADDAACPECGLPVCRSRAPGRALRDAPPGWLFSVLLGACVVFVVVAGSPLVPQAIGSVLGRVRIEWVAFVFGLLMLAESAFLAAGVFLITRPLAPFTPPAVAAQWSARAIALLLLAQQAAGFVSVGWVLRLRRPGFTPFLWLILGCLLLVHLRRLALRLPNPRLAWQCGPPPPDSRPPSPLPPSTSTLV